MMATANRREVLRQLLSGLFATAGAATVVLASASVQAGTTEANGEEKPLPVENPASPQQNLEERADQAVANAGAGVQVETEDEDAFLNGGGFRNGGGFLNGGGFRNGGGFQNGGGFLNGGGFRNTPIGGFRNGPSFRNW